MMTADSQPPWRLGVPCPDEAEAARALGSPIDETAAGAVRTHAVALVERARSQGQALRFDIQSFLAAFPISEPTGVSLLRLAEALPRTPDDANQIALLADKVDAIAAADRRAAGAGHRAPRRGRLVKAMAAALGVADRLLPDADRAASGQAPGGALADWVVRPAARSTVSALGRRFVFGESIDQAMRAARRARRGQPGGQDLRYSFDMLGEGARTWDDADANLARYRQALAAVAAQARAGAGLGNDGLSVKVSAIHPRYETAQYRHEKPRLLERLLPLAQAAAAADIGLTLDAEESERLELHLDLFVEFAMHPSLRGWSGLGLVVQAYQLRAPALVRAVIELARHRRVAGGAPVAVRLVKGAYWDAEIKRAQELGLAGYPVFTDKGATDRSWLACAALLLDDPDAVYPQFASHNAVTLAGVLELSRRRGVAADRFELQRLHGMGDAVHGALPEIWQVATGAAPPACRVYAPVGDQQQLLAYLIRRMLENGASTSFVRRLGDRSLSAERLVDEETALLAGQAADSGLPLPAELYGPARRNAAGFDLQDASTLARFAAAAARPPTDWPVVADARAADAAAAGLDPLVVVSPADRTRLLARLAPADVAQVRQAVLRAERAFEAWQATAADARAGLLERWADAIESDLDALVALCVHEAGKTLADAIADVREAVDFCRYYAAEARRLMGAPLALPGPTGERNELRLAGRGVFACISPWNFPVAIFVGQAAAALAAGNTVVAKPAEQTPLAALRAAGLAHRAGLDPAVLQVLVGGGETTGAALVADPRVGGVAFTGSNAAARAIQRVLLDTHDEIVPLIAETGGQNAMIVDSTALPEQVVDAVLHSAFRSAGQRCSALRVLALQHEIADGMVAMIRGAAATLVVGDPADPATDVGPVIDDDARGRLAAHVEAMRAAGRDVWQLPLPPACGAGHFVAPTIIELRELGELDREHFGPVLHVVRFAIGELDALVDAINATRFGLTLGIHTRIDARAERIRCRARVGNVYVNRSMIGAVVGVQPFGGERLSGTGPKAGGPHYLPRFAVERTCTVNTAAAGGDLALLTRGTGKSHGAASTARLRR